MKKAKLILAVAAVLLAVSGLAAGGEYPYQVVDLGTNMSPWAINDLGEVAGGGYMGYGQAFLWTSSQGIQYLGTLGGQNSTAYDISNSGVIVGASQITNQPERAFKWTATGGIQQLQLLGNQSIAWAVNESGEIAGLHVQNDVLACYWDSNGTAHSAGGVGTAQQQSFRGINEAGVAAGFGRSDSDGHHHAFTWTMAGGVRDLGVLAGEETHVKAISDSGMIVGYSNPGAIAYAWSEADGLHILPPLSGQCSSAEGVNSNDEVVGAYWGASTPSHAFLWTQDKGIFDISPPGWTGTFAYDINKWGWIVGAGIAPDGQQHGFLLIPEPATLSLLALGGMGLLKRCRRRG